MKTLLEIQNEVAIENGFEDWVLVMDSMRDPQLWPEVCRRAQLECARETLKEAAENVKTVETDTITDQQYFNGAPPGYDIYLSVDKSSITNEANIKLIQ